MRPGTVKKYNAIKDRFYYLYNIDRRRYDDCIDQIMEEYFIDHRVTVSRILTSELLDLPQDDDHSQLSMFEV